MTSRNGCGNTRASSGRPPRATTGCAMKPLTGSRNWKMILTMQSPPNGSGAYPLPTAGKSKTFPICRRSKIFLILRQNLLFPPIFPISHRAKRPTSGESSFTILWVPGPKSIGPLAAGASIPGTRGRMISTHWWPACSASLRPACGASRR